MLLHYGENAMRYLRPMQYLMLLTICGCAHSVHRQVDGPPAPVIAAVPSAVVPAHTDVDRNRPPSNVPLTKTVRLVADTQFHESRGTASRFWSRAGDELVDVTIRTAQQVIGAPDILFEAVKQNSDKYGLTLHLGDAIDVSCRTEWDRFFSVMTKSLGDPSATTWIFTPGNHDGFLVGNFFPMQSGQYNQFHWANVCNVGRVGENENVTNDRIMKPDLLRSYISRLTSSKKQIPDLGSDSSCNSDMSLCLAYAMPSNPWSSFLVQLIQLPSPNPTPSNIYSLLLDTSDYPSKPYITWTAIKAGNDAGLSSAQLKAALALIELLPENARFFIAGHHNWEAWHTATWPAQHSKDLQALLSNKRFMKFLITAHTHEGAWADQQLGDITFSELNIGSLIDPPVYFRTLDFVQDNAGNVAVVSQPVMLEQQSDVDCHDFKLPPPGSFYSIADQESLADKFREAAQPVRAALRGLSAIGKFLTFWRQKHLELRPQLLVYADVVDASFLETQGFSFYPFGISQGKFTFSDRAALTSRLRYLATCFHKNKCSIQEKGHLLHELDEFYWDLPSDSTVFKKGHAARYCFALRSTETIGGNSKITAEITKRARESTRILYNSLK